MTRPVTIGVIGLGTMGLPIAERLLRSGPAVTGYDIDPERSDALGRLGGYVASSVAELAATTMILTLLPSDEALAQVVDELCAARDSSRREPAPDLVDLGTLSVDAKRAARHALAHVGVAMLDGALSGTAVQVPPGDIVVFTSGDEAVFSRCKPVLETIGSRVQFLGEFGRATRTKLVANHLVAVHVAAAAEALVLADHSGLDPATTIGAISGGAGSSRMLEIRGPLMVAESYQPPSMRMELFLKDLGLIEAQARGSGAPTPLFDAAAALFRAAVAGGYGDHDTAAIRTWLDLGVAPEATT